MGVVEECLKALHPLRGMIIRLLAEKGSLTYSELMRLTKVDDSGTFGFHLRGEVRAGALRVIVGRMQPPRA